MFMTNHLSLDVDVFEEDAHDDVVAGVDISKFFPAATDDLVCVLLASCVTTPALRLNFIICSFLFPTHRMGSFISIISFVVFGLPFRVILLVLERLISIVICQDLLQKQRRLSLLTR